MLEWVFKSKGKDYFGWVPTCKVNGYGASNRLTIEDLESVVRHVKSAREDRTNGDLEKFGSERT